MSNDPEPAIGRLAELERLAQLRSSGAITDEEYSALKSEILHSPGDAKLPDAVTERQHAEVLTREWMGPETQVRKRRAGKSPWSLQF